MGMDTVNEHFPKQEKSFSSATRVKPLPLMGTMVSCLPSLTDISRDKHAAGRSMRQRMRHAAAVSDDI